MSSPVDCCVRRMPAPNSHNGPLEGERNEDTHARFCFRPRTRFTSGPHAMVAAAQIIQLPAPRTYATAAESRDGQTLRAKRPSCLRGRAHDLRARHVTNCARKDPPERSASRERAGGRPHTLLLNKGMDPQSAHAHGVHRPRSHLVRRRHPRPFSGQ